MHSIKSLVDTLVTKEKGNQFRFVRDEVAMVSHGCRSNRLLVLLNRALVAYAVLSGICLFALNVEFIRVR